MFIYQKLYIYIYTYNPIRSPIRSPSYLSMTIAPLAPLAPPQAAAPPGSLSPAGAKSWRGLPGLVNIQKAIENYHRNSGFSH